MSTQAKILSELSFGADNDQELVKMVFKSIQLQTATASNGGHSCY